MITLLWQNGVLYCQASALINGFHAITWPALTRKPGEIFCLWTFSLLKSECLLITRVLKNILKSNGCLSYSTAWGSSQHDNKLMWSMATRVGSLVVLGTLQHVQLPTAARLACLFKRCLLYLGMWNVSTSCLTSTSACLFHSAQASQFISSTSSGLPGFEV